ncbi:MAG: hypothetical protein MMC33_009415 [Icmadophila ericetorum]|nr:hypothetical protein [Icmadophila ericetorum]
MQRNAQPPLRTTEAIHACVNQYSELDDNGMELALASPHSPHSLDPATQNSSCHSHNLEYVSSSSPIEPDTYSGLRRATIRTLSGEQLPRGHTSGPLFFGDPVHGYTIAYVFRLADLHARGHQRYYALLALAGSDTRRAFEACTIIWSFFEQLAINIIEKAEHVALQASPADDSPSRSEYITPISSFLTGRTMDPDGYTRRGAAHVRANSIAELVDDKEFFCELHMTFVGMLQELGRILGGVRVNAPPGENDSRSEGVRASHSQSNRQDKDEDQLRQRLPKSEKMLSLESGRSGGRSQIPSCSPSLSMQLQQVIV